MKIISFNVNGLRAILKKNFVDDFYSLIIRHFCTLIKSKMKNICRFAILTGDLSAHLEHSDRRNKGCPKRILTNQANCGILPLVSALK